MSILKFICFVLLITSAATTLAAGPSFNYLGAGYALHHVDDCDPDGLYLEGSATLNEFVFFEGRHIDVVSDLCGSTSTFASAGIRSEVGSSSYVYGLATVLYRDYGNDSDAGLGVRAGIRSFVSQGVEARGYAGYELADELDQFYVGAGINYWLTRDFSLSGDLSLSDSEGQVLTAGLRFNF